MRIYDGKFLILDLSNGFAASNITVAELEKLGGKDEVKLRRHEQTGMVLPEIVNKPAYSQAQVNIEGWFSNVLNNREQVPNLVQPVIDMLAQSGHTIDETIAQQLLDIPLECDLNRTKSIDKRLLAYAEGDMQAAIILNRLVLVDDVEYENTNEFLRMRKEDDEVRLQLPDADTIITHQLGTPYYIDKLREVWATPLPNRLYDYKDIVDILNAPTPEKRKTLINDLLTALTAPKGFDLKLDASELSELRDRFEIIPLEHVIGLEENDTKGIFENEQAFYDNLIAFTKWHIKRFHREVLGNIDEAELEARTEADFAKGEIPVRLKEYFNSLIRTVSRTGFKFTGNFMYISGDVDGDYDSDESEDVSFSESSSSRDESSSMDKVNYINQKANPNQSDLNVVISEYLDSSAPTQGASVWAEAIVKLMRWGSRKIKNLVVGTNNQLYLDLVKSQILTQQLANLADFEVDRDSQGRSLEILGATYVDFKAEGESRVRSYPFILLGVEEGYLPNVEEPITVTYTTTLFDIVKQFLAGEGIVYDIQFDGEKFIDELDRRPLAEYQFTDVATAKRKNKVLEELKDYAVDNGIADIGGTSNAVLRVRELAPFQELSPVLPRLSADSKTRTRIVQGTMLAIFQEGAQDFDSTELAPLLNWYYENVYPTHLEQWNECLGLAPQQQENNVNARNMAASTLFTGNNEEGEVEVEVEEEMEFMYPIYEGEPLAFGPIERSKGSGQIIGAYATTPSGRVFASLDEVEQFDVGVPTIHLGGVLTGMFEVMLTADTQNNLVSKHKVLSSNSIAGIYAKHLGH